MSAAAQEANCSGWVVASVAALPGMLEDIIERTNEAAEHLFTPPEGRHVASLGLGQMVELSWSEPAVAPANWRTRMNKLLDALAERGVGLLVTVDEVQPDLDEMVQLAAVCQHFVRENRKVALLMAGLPHNMSQLLQDRSVSFLRRAQGAFLGRLADIDVEETLRATFEMGGRDVSRALLSRAANAVEGFPFMLQLVGFRIWDQSPTELAVSEDDVEARASQAALWRRVPL